MSSTADLMSRIGRLLGHSINNMMKDDVCHEMAGKIEEQNQAILELNANIEWVLDRMQVYYDKLEGVDEGIQASIAFDMALTPKASLEARDKAIIEKCAVELENNVVGGVAVARVIRRIKP